MKKHFEGCNCDDCFAKWKKKQKERSQVEQVVLFRAGEDPISKAYNDFGDRIAGMQEDCPELLQDLVDKGLIQVNQKK
ncbi:hypothetical protein KAR91_41865 [Candidatus Pacearchaeota archaeon]|nr:hypothetical protein [Candidatus Pacearchaeota archaeon]